MYNLFKNGNLSEPKDFGKDRLISDESKLRCLEIFLEEFPSFETIYDDIVSRNTTTFRNALMYFIQITNELNE